MKILKFIFSFCLNSFLYFLTFVPFLNLSKRKFLGFKEALLFNTDLIKRSAFITSALFFKCNVTRDELIKMLKNRVSSLSPFTHKIVSSWISFPYYKKLKNLKIEDYVKEHKFKIGNFEEYEDVLSAKQTEKMNLHGKALWEFDIYHNYVAGNENKNGCVIFFKLHHCIADGGAAIKLLFHLTDKINGKNGKNVDSVSDNMEKNIEKLKKKTRLENGVFKNCFYFVYSLLKVLLQSKDDKKTYFANRGGVKKGQKLHCVVNKREILIEPILKASKKLNCSFNDIVEASVAGGIRLFLQKRGNINDKKYLKVNKSALKTVTWMNRRKESLSGLVSRLSKLKNYKMNEKDLEIKLGTVFHIIPYHIEDKIERLKWVKNNLSELYKSYEPFYTDKIMDLMGFVPPFLSLLLWERLAYKSSMSISNVMGPTYKRLFCKKVLEGVAFYINPAGTVSEMMTLLTYGGKMFIAIDGIVEKKPINELMHLILKELDEYVELGKCK